MSLLTKRSRPFTTSLSRDRRGNLLCPETLINNHYSVIDLSQTNKNHHVNFNPTIAVKEINEIEFSNKKSPSLIQEDEFADEPLPTSPSQQKFQHVVYSPPPSKSRAKTAYPKEQAPTATDEQIAQLTEALKISEPQAKSPVVHEAKPSAESNHWLIYKQDPTPEYIIEAKKRLGQIKQKFVPPMSQLVAKSKEATEICAPTRWQEEAPAAKFVSSNPNRHWLTFENPVTPENVREIRKRLGDDRYKRLPSGFQRATLNRSKTCMEQYNSGPADANFKSETIAANLNADSGFLVENNNTNSIVIEKDNNLTILDTTAELTDVSRLGLDERYKIPLFNASENLFDGNENVNSAVLGSATNSQAELAPPTYEYNNSKHLDTTNASSGSNEGQQQLNELTNLLRSNSSYSNSKPRDEANISETLQDGPVPIPFESWLKTANDSERNSVMRVLREMERSPKPLIQQSRSKSSNQYVKVKAKGVNSSFRPGQLNQQPFSNSRGSSRVQTPTTRKLGTTRNSHLFPCEVCEKMLVKKHLWEYQQTPCMHQGYNF